MRPILIDTKSTLQDSVYVKDVHVPYLDIPFHFHNAYEMVLILKSDGKRIVGDNVEPFSDGDLILMGPNLPHVWYNERDYYETDNPNSVEAIVIYFHPDWLSEHLLESSELNRLKQLLTQMQRGIKVLGKTRKRLIKNIIKIKNKAGLKRIIKLLNILEMLSSSDEYECLASVGYVNSFNQKDVKRIDKVYQYVMSNYTKKIMLKEVATVACMTPTAFCKYFKSRTKKTFSNFLNEIRIGYACKLLCDENLSISQIYYECGFNNFTNFNRSFKEIKNMSPTEFRTSLKIS